MAFTVILQYVMWGFVTSPTLNSHSMFQQLCKVHLILNILLKKRRMLLKFVLTIARHRQNRANFNAMMDPYNRGRTELLSTIYTILCILISQVFVCLTYLNFFDNFFKSVMASQIKSIEYFHF